MGGPEAELDSWPGLGWGDCPLLPPPRALTPGPWMGGRLLAEATLCPQARTLRSAYWPRALGGQLSQRLGS